MTTLHTIMVNLHIAVGAVVLVLFWVPALARKGSTLHVRAGRVYVYLMYVVVASAFVASILVLVDPLAVRRPGATFTADQAATLSARFRMFSLFLLMLSVLVAASLRHGIAALEARRNPGALRTRAHRSGLVVLGLLGVVVGVIGVQNRQLLLMVFAVISVVGAVRMFRDTLHRDAGPGRLVAAHLNGLIGSGIGAYTAFFAFGGSRLLADVLTGQWMVIPWVLPAVIGTIASIRLQRAYIRKPGHS